MRIGAGFALCALLGLPGVAAGAAPADALDTIEASIAGAAERHWSDALQIWSWAEPGYQETRSSALLAARLEEAGFRVERGVAGMPTAFVASFGGGAPVIGVLAEFDALPGFSQEAAPSPRPRDGQTWGHACGHHLFGVGSVAAAIAVADAIRAGQLGGTVRLYGTPAEEGGGAKTFMVRDGLFSGVDAVLHWHCNDRNVAGDPTNQARVAAKFRFHGISAHAAAAPEEGRSALDAVDVMNYAAELLREHTPDLTRIHRVITAGGLAPNVVPDFAEVYYYVRHPDPRVAEEVFARLVKCAEAGALATGTELEIEHLGGVSSILPNDTLAEVSLRNLTELNDLSYTAEERGFALELQESLSKPLPLDTLSQVLDRRGETETGSTDVGDVSWVVPTTGVAVACWVPGTPAHSWQAVAAGGTTIGRKGMLLAARTLAATAADLMSDPGTLERAREELERRVGETPYRPMLEPGQQPPLHYRDPPKHR
jgi:aminobenzoyl-glutamate utilization protein B